MNLLILSTWFPYPPDNGSRLRAFHLIAHLARRHRVRVVAGAQDDIAAGVRLEDATLAARLGCAEVVSVPWRWYRAEEQGSSACVAREMRTLFSPTPRSILFTDNPPLRAAIADQLRRPTDAILVLEQGMAPFLPTKAFLGGVPAVIDQVEVTGPQQIFAEARTWRARLRAGLTLRKGERYWGRVLRRFAAVTAVSETEAQAVRDVLGRGRVRDHGGADGAPPPVVVVPNGVDVQEYSALRVAEQQRSTAPAAVPGRLVYNGSLGYGPNQDAVRWFATEVLPRVADICSDVHLVVTGRSEHLGSEIEDLRSNPRITLTGFVPDLRPVLDEAALCVVPLRHGGGTRLKILEAFAAGLPVVSTTRGAAGIEAEHGRHLLLADTPESFATCVARLLQEPDEAVRLARAARNLVEARYDWADIAASLSCLLERVAGTVTDPTDGSARGCPPCPLLGASTQMRRHAR